MLGKPTCLLMFGAESPWDAFSVLPLCPAGLGLHSDRLKITFRGKNCSMCTFLMQRLSPRGFGGCSTWQTNSSARATRPEPCAAGCHLLQAQLENCTEGLRAWPSSAATPLCHSTAPGCSSSGVSAHPQPFWAPALHLTPVLTLLRLQAATPGAGAEARTHVRMLSRGDPGPLFSVHWINSTPNSQGKKRKKKIPDRQLN